MQLKIHNGVVELSGEPILNKVDFEINDNSHIAVVGRNGCGKTTLLKLIAGEYSITKLDSDTDSYFTMSGNATVGMLSQMTFADNSKSMLEEIKSAYSYILDTKAKLDLSQSVMEENPTPDNIKTYTNLLDTFTNLGGFYYEREYEAAIKSFGFTEEEKHRPLSAFSGGQRTKIAFLKLLLSKPDILLLDEPTNHLDITATEWLEGYLKDYKKAFVVVSHDRMFLDNIAQIVYEIENGKTHKYIGNYTQFCENKKLLRAQQQKQYEAQQKEIAHLSDLADRFRYKATKAAMAQSKLKQIERMDVIDSPEKQDLRTFKADFEPDDLGVKDMLTVKDLCVGYNKPITTVSLEVLQGERVGIIGGNGLGKSTFIETIMGNIPKISGEFRFAHRAKIGYFSQQMAAYSSDKTVLDDFIDEYPELTVKECRSALGAFLFSGEEVFKTVNMLSGGEKVRLALCKIFKAKPNFLVLDEPTNHMDIVGKEALEDMLSVYNGTVLFVSHDRYFVKKIATNILNFNEGSTEFYRFGYEDFLNFKSKETVIESITVQKASSSKKSFTTPLKEKSRLEKAVTKCEDKISNLEVKIEEINTQLSLDDVISEYVRLTQLQTELSALENALNEEYLQWEELSEKLNQISRIIKFY